MDPKRRISSKGGAWQCAVKRRESHRALYTADPAGANYRRTRKALRARIRRKRRQIEELESLLEEENTR